MRDPSLLFELRHEVDVGSPVLIEALDGFVDAGHGVALTRDHLLRTFPSEVVAVFDVDELLDYRSRRPLLVFDSDHWESYDEPELVLHALRDANGASLLLLTGPEPDTQWERFAAAAILLIKQLGVRLEIGLHAVPWAAPHTRPMGLSTFGRPRELLFSSIVGVGRVQVPASAGQVLQFRLQEAGHDTVGLAAHVPHYLALAEYPEAAVTLLAGVERLAGLALEFDDLRAAAAETKAEVDAQVGNDEQTAAAIRALEEQHDAVLRQGGLALGEALPTGDELGEAFERFLAERARRATEDDQPSP